MSQVVWEVLISIANHCCVYSTLELREKRRICFNKRSNYLFTRDSLRTCLSIVYFSYSLERTFRFSFTAICHPFFLLDLYSRYKHFDYTRGREEEGDEKSRSIEHDEIRWFLFNLWLIVKRTRRIARCLVIVINKHPQSDKNCQMSTSMRVLTAMNRFFFLYPSWLGLLVACEI